MSLVLIDFSRVTGDVTCRARILVIRDVWLGRTLRKWRLGRRCLRPSESDDAYQQGCGVGRIFNLRSRNRRKF